MNEIEKYKKQIQDIRNVIHDFKSDSWIPEDNLGRLMVATLALIEISHILKIDLLENDKS